MKIAPETFTVVPHPAESELSLLIAGLRIVLDLDEARALTAQLISGMKAICRVERVGDRIARPAEPVVVEPVVRQQAVAEAEPALGPASRSAPAAVKEAPVAVKEAPDSVKEAILALKEASIAIKEAPVDKDAPAAKDVSVEVKDRAAGRDLPRRNEEANASPSKPSRPTEPEAALAQADSPQPGQGGAEGDKKSTKKLRSLLKALVKEDDNSFSGGL